MNEKVFVASAKELSWLAKFGSSARTYLDSHPNKEEYHETKYQPTETEVVMLALGYECRLVIEERAEELGFGNVNLYCNYLDRANEAADRLGKELSAALIETVNGMVRVICPGLRDRDPHANAQGEVATDDDLETVTKNLVKQKGRKEAAAKLLDHLIGLINAEPVEEGQQEEGGG
jgi:hypothetical protein